jgi:hypothetical protein
MFRKLLILGAIAALFTIATAVPASAIAVNKGGPNGEAVSVIVPQFGPHGGPNDAHGPACGTIDAGTPGGCFNHSSPDAAIAATAAVPGLNAGINLGAWNAVFQSSDNSAICGIWAKTTEAEAGFEEFACDYGFANEMEGS